VNHAWQLHNFERNGQPEFGCRRVATPGAAIRRLAAGESISDLFSCVVHGGIEEDVCMASVNE